MNDSHVCASKIFRVLLAQNSITPATVQLLEAYMERWQVSDMQALLETKLLDDARLADILARHFKLERVRNLTRRPIPLEVLRVLSFVQAVQHECLPLAILPAENGHGPKVRLAIADPTNDRRLLEVESLMHRSVAPVVATQREILEAVYEFYPLTEQIPILRDTRESAGDSKAMEKAT